jgi:TIR domain
MPREVIMERSIFLSYRRDDASGYAHAIYARLREEFSDHQIFMDVDTIKPGADFVEAIDAALASCGVLLALIGRNWLSSNSESGRRIDNSNDFVRIEISRALERRIPIIPVLLDGASTPRSEDLPENIRYLARRNAFEIRSTRFQSDLGQLIDVLKRTLQPDSPQTQHLREGASLSQEVKETTNPTQSKLAQSVPVPELTSLVSRVSRSTPRRWITTGATIFCSAAIVTGLVLSALFAEEALSEYNIGFMTEAQLFLYLGIAITITGLCGLFFVVRRKRRIEHVQL